jgi:O-antigen/teichoic acid export membrane protein
MKIYLRFAKNAVANLGRGSATAVVALLLPAVLVRHMAQASYAVWVLVLQTAAYVSYLNFGLQTAIGRYVAFANEKNDVVLRDSVLSTAFAGLCAAALVAFVLLSAAVAAVPIIFPSVPHDLIPQMRLALLIVGFALAVELPASAWNGVFVGLQRYEIPALTVGSARLAGAIGVVAVALASGSLAAMAVALASANLLSYLAQYVILRRVAPDVSFKASLVSRSTSRELVHYCWGLTVMSFSMLLITGLDLVLVGRFQFSAVTPYSVAAGMSMFMSGLLFAVINVIMPHAARLHAAGKERELGRLTISSTMLSVLLLVLSGMPILIYAQPIIRLWIGERYVESGVPLLSILIVANIVRLIGAPYSTVLVAAGQQSYIKISPLAEGISNFIASVVLGFFLGAIGVALGTLIGSFIGVGAHLWYSMPRTKSAIAFSRRDFVLSGVMIPLICTSLLPTAAIASLLGLKVHDSIICLAVVISLVGIALLMWYARLNSLWRSRIFHDPRKAF